MLTLLLLLTSAVAQPADTSRDALKPSSAVYVEPTREHEAHVHLGRELAAWGRWRVVERLEDADLVVRLQMHGNARRRGGLAAVIHDARTDAPLWTSRRETHTRGSVFTGYTNPYEKAAVGLVDQMREASNAWPLK